MERSNLPSTSSASSASSASTSYAHTNHYVNDVFINHRGPDCKKTLATDLYNDLRKFGLRVFLDQRELQEGDGLNSQIEGAIREASVHKAIFSKTYADSPWCLDELHQMLQSGATVLPVFYGVKPSDLRWTEGKREGVYAEALFKLTNKETFDNQTHREKPRHSSDSIEKWRHALSVAANISGFEVDKYTGEHQFIQQIVETVLKNVKRQVHVSKYPIGLDQKVRDFEMAVSLQPQSRETRVIGIVGLGGVGKTTLAKEIFNHQISKYDRSCRLSDVREKPLTSSQSKLLEDLARWTGQIDDTDDGIVKIKRYIPSHRALIIFDDVDHSKQLNALLPVKYSIQPGSLILITSRNRDVLTPFGIEKSSIYELKGLNAQYSQELFCLHAFGQPRPVVRFEGMVGKFLVACCGLPLSLEVFGAFLCGKDDLRDWEEYLSQISKILPEDIQGRLKISYNGLDNEEEKQIFLDIACFFIGEDSNTALRIWKGSGWSGWLGLRKLENRCLVEVDSESRIRMHDHIRDLGRDLAKENPPHRLWRPTLEDLQNLFDESPVRGISMVQHYSSEWSDPQSFKNLAELPGSRLVTNMRKLELLRAKENFVEIIFDVLQSPLFSPQLVWLCWYSCPFSSLPTCISLKKLRVLEITGDKLETLWRDESQAPVQLRELNIDAPLSETPKFIGKMKDLEIIVLHQNERVEEVDLENFLHELCDLQSLKSLVLRKCSKMKSLPESFGNLTNLEYLDLSGCSGLQRLPNSFGKLRNLQLIDFSGCFSLKTFPRGRWKRSKPPRIE